MDTRAIAALLLASLLTASLAGCSGAATGPRTSGGPATEPAASAAPTLTKATLPTKVGTKWTMIRRDEENTPLSLTVAGPWDLQAGSDWRTESYEIVDPVTVPGIGDFQDYTFVLRVVGHDVDTYYYPRQVTDEWVFGLGRIHATDAGPKTEVQEATKFWPLNLEVGQSYTIFDNDKITTVATVLSHAEAKVPAGTIKDAYLTRFRTTYKAGDQKQNDYYYLFAPNIGQVAYFSRLIGDEEKGFTAAGSIVLLAEMPK